MCSLLNKNEYFDSSGSELYEDSVNDLGFDFNPWEDTLDVYRVKHDFKLGVVKANCELRQTDQKGYIDCKDCDMQNLRQGSRRWHQPKRDCIK